VALGRSASLQRTSSQARSTAGVLIMTSAAAAAIIRVNILERV
jgi:hypothetical protein